MTELSDAVVLVVGGTGGLGRRIATALEAEGAVVARSGRTADDGVVAADLRTDRGTAELVRAVVDEHGRLDGLVVAAGVVAFGPIAEVTDETLVELVEVNALAPIRLVRDALPALTASAEAGRSPFVVTLSGVVSEAPTAQLAAYSASKAAVAAFVVAATRELRRSGIRLLDARPGHTDTGLAEHPVQGTAPAFGRALDPDAVAERIVRAIADDEKDLPSTAF